MKRLERKETLGSYLRIAEVGHYPLFFEDWLKVDLKENHSMTNSAANKKVKDIFATLNKHRTEEKKKTYLLSLKDKDRMEFIQAFYSMVENKILNDLKTLH